MSSSSESRKRTMAWLDDEHADLDAGINCLIDEAFLSGAGSTPIIRSDARQLAGAVATRLKARLRKLQEQASQFDELLDTKQVAERFGLAPSTLDQYRSRGIGPDYIRLHDHSRAPVRYRPRDVQAWIDERSAATK